MGKGFDGVENLFQGDVSAPTTGSMSGFVRPERVLTMIRIDTIVDHSPNQKRIITFDPDNIAEDQELLLSVKKYGVLEPIIVKKYPGQLGQSPNHLLIAGHRRCSAAKYVGREYIPALIAKEDDDVSIITLVENTGIRKLSSWELAMSIDHIAKENPEWEIPEIIEKSGIPKSTVYNSLKVMNESCPALLGLCERGMGSRTVLELQKVFSKIISEEKQEEFAGLLENNITHKKVEELRSMVDSGVDPFVALSMSIRNIEQAPTIMEERNEKDVVEEGVSREETVSQHDKGTADRDSSGSKKKDVSVVLLPDIEDKNAISSISLLTGLSYQRTKNLLKIAKEEGVSVKEFSIACKFVNAGGNKDKAFQIANSVQSNNKINDLLMAHQKLCSQANRIWDDDSIDEELRTFVYNIVFGKREL